MAYPSSEEEVLAPLGGPGACTLPSFLHKLRHQTGPTLLRGRAEEGLRPYNQRGVVGTSTGGKTEYMGTSRGLGYFRSLW